MYTPQSAPRRILTVQPFKEIRFTRATDIYQTEHSIKLLCSPDRLMVLVGQAFEVLIDAHLCLVTRHSFPDGRPELTGVHYGRKSPIWPWRRPSFDTIHVGDQTAQRSLIGLPFLPAPLDVIQFRYAMRSARLGFPGGGDNRGSRELRDGDVIGMAVGAFGTKGNDHVGLHSTDVVGNPCHRLGDVY